MDMFLDVVTQSLYKAEVPPGLPRFGWMTTSCPQNHKTQHIHTGGQTLLCSIKKNEDRLGITHNAGSFAMLQIPTGSGETKMKEYGRCV